MSTQTLGARRSAGYPPLHVGIARAVRRTVTRAQPRYRATWEDMLPGPVLPGQAPPTVPMSAAQFLAERLRGR